MKQRKLLKTNKYTKQKRRKAFKTVNLQISQCFIGNNQGKSYQEAILEKKRIKQGSRVGPVG